MTKRLLVIALGVVMVMAAVPAAGASDVGIAQPTELFPPDGEVPVLYPPDSELQGHADLVVLIDRGRFDRTWRDVREIIEQADGWIVSASSAVGEHEGRTYEYGTVEMRVPAFRFEEAIGWFAALGQTIGADIAYDASRGVDSTIVVTITEEGEPFFGSPDPGSQSRIEQALDTAGDVLLTMAAVLIVAGAVIVPVAILAVLAYLVWRSARRRWPIAEPGAAVAEPQEDPEPVDA